MTARSDRRIHLLRNSVHVQDGGCSLLLTCTAPHSVSRFHPVPLLLHPPPSPSLSLFLPKRPCPFEDDENGAPRRDACVVGSASQQFTITTTRPLPCFSRRNEAWSWWKVRSARWKTFLDASSTNH